MYKDKVVQKEYQHQWYLNKKTGLPTATKQIKLTEKERINRKRNSVNKCNRKIRNYRKKIVEKILGNKCYFCGREGNEEYRLQSHRKDGKKHNNLGDGMPKVEFDKEVNSGKYVRVCIICHRGVHWCMKILGMNWDNITGNVV